VRPSGVGDLEGPITCLDLVGELERPRENAGEKHVEKVELAVRVQGRKLMRFRKLRELGDEAIFALPVKKLERVWVGFIARDKGYF
jgi:hypothetical protein